MSALVQGRRLAAAFLAFSLLLIGSAGVLPAAGQVVGPPVLDDPPGTALDWLEGELVADGGHLRTSYDDGEGGVASFDDWGLTIDAVLALAAGDRGGDAAATTAAGQVEANVAVYVTGGTPDDRYAGAMAKALLVAQIQGLAPTSFGGFNLVDELLDRLQTSGPDTGRFSDRSDFGDSSNGFGQALAILALARTPEGVPDSAVDFLLDQQCPGGGFRGDYTSSGGCTSDGDSTVDATGFALQALVTVELTCAVRQAVTDGVASLLAGQNASGAFGGESGSNTNSTGLAAVALRSLGSASAADQAAAFVAGLQLTDGDDVGAIALNAEGLAAAADGVQELERDGFRRASTQGVLALGLPSYGEIGADPVDPGAYEPCPPVGEEPDPVTPTATLSASVVAPGDQLTVSATGFSPDEAVAVTLYSTPVDLGTATADASGSVSFTFTVPVDLEPGAHRVELVGARSGVRVAATFEVLGVEVPRTLPATGRSTAAPIGIGLGLVLTGGALLAATRRRPAPRTRERSTSPR